MAAVESTRLYHCDDHDDRLNDIFSDKKSDYPSNLLNYQPDCKPCNQCDDHPDCEKRYEYLDHTADVQLHAWGVDMEEAIANCALAMYGYMTDLDTVEELTGQVIEAQGEDMLSLLYQFLDECLFLFSADPFFIAKRVVIEELDCENFKIKAVGYGEEFDLTKHPQGTEVKAITYSNMQAHDIDQSPNDFAHVFVVIDI